MNLLQNIPDHVPFFVTLNYKGEVKNILKTIEYTHPIFDLQAVQAQKLASTIQGGNNFWFCEACMRYGFHEDGMTSALNMLDLREKSSVPF